MPKHDKNTPPDVILQSYQDASAGRFNTGPNGAKHRPFSFEAAVEACSGWVFAAAMINANAVASVPLRLYVRKRPGQKCLLESRPLTHKRRDYLAGLSSHHPSPLVCKSMEYGDWEEVSVRHPLTDLLSSSNPITNGFDLTAQRIMWQELTGNAYLLKQGSIGLGGPPAALWPLPPQWTWVIPDPTRRRWLDGYLYGSDMASRVIYQPEQVIHFKRPHPSNMYYGLGKLQAAWAAVRIDHANHAMDQALADNQARPDYIIAMEGADEKTVKRTQTQVDARHRNPNKSGRPMVVGGGKVDIKTLTFAPKELEGRDDVIEEIAAIFQVPVSLLKANDPNLASAEAGYGHWRAGTILPLCRMDEQQLNQDLVPHYSLDDLCLAYDNPVPADLDKEHERGVKSTSYAIRTINEQRVIEGLEPSDDPAADKLLFNGKPIGGDDQADKPVVLTADDVAAVVTKCLADPSVKPVTAEPVRFSHQDLLQIVEQVNSGKVPRDSAISIMRLTMGLDDETASGLLGSAGTVASVELSQPRSSALDIKALELAAKSAYGQAADEIVKQAVSDLDDLQQDMEAVSESAASGYDFASVQVDVTQDEVVKRLKAVADMIPEEHLTGKGREDQFHVTCLYGLVSDEADPVIQILEDSGQRDPFELTLEGYGLFETDEHDVIYVAVVSDWLHRTHDVLKNLAHKSDYPDYVPHLTLAYVAKGQGQWLIESLPSFAKTAVTVDQLTFSPAVGEPVTVVLD
jgi:HK97 family phage portal protein